MFNFLVTFLLTSAASLYGSNDKALLAGDVSPAAPKNSSAPMQDDSSDNTGEVDEDVIITEDENSDDDEGVNN